MPSSSTMRLQALLGAVLLLASSAAAQSANVTSASTSTVVSSLILNAAIFAIEISVFLLLRPRFARIYQPKSMLGPRSERTAPLPSSLFGWIPRWLKTPDIEIMHKQGIDAFQFVKYLEMMVRIFAPIWAFTWALLMPLYGVEPTVGNTGFNQFTFGNIAKPKNQQLRYIGVLFAQWICTFWIIWNIKQQLGAFVQRRQQWLLSPAFAHSAQAKTVLITGVPNDHLSERKLQAMYGQLPGGVAKIWLNRDLKELPDLFDDRLDACNKLEKAEAKLIKIASKKVRKNKVDAGEKDAEMSLDVADRYVEKKERPSHKLGAMGCFGEKVDTIEWAREEIARLNKEIDEQRSYLSDFEKYPPQNSAFILFNRQIAAAMAVKTHAHHAPYRMANHYAQAHPLDIIWPNLNMNPYEAKIRTAIFWAATIGLVVFWILPVAFVGIISNIQGLCVEVPFLSWLCKIPKPVVGIIQGILPTVLLAVLNMLLPIVLRLFARLSGVPTKTGVELSLMDRFFLFQLINNFLFLTIISGVSSGITDIVGALKDPTKLPGLLAEKIPLASIFFLSFIALQGLTGAASGFMQIVGLAIFYVKGFLLNSTPRSVWHIHNNIGQPAMGTLFPVTSLISVIAIGYMIMAPITAGFATVSFILFYLLYKYNYLYVYDIKPETETGGLFFPKACTHLFAALYLEEVILTVLFFVAQDSNEELSAIPEGAFMIVLIVLTAGAHYIISNSYGDLYTAFPLSLAPSAQEEANEQQSEDKKQLNHSSQADGSTAIEMHESHQNLVDDEGPEEDPMLAFQHPATKEPQRTLWFAADRFGLGDAAVAGAKKRGLDATNRDTSVNEKGKISTDAHVPPGELLL